MCQTFLTGRLVVTRTACIRSAANYGTSRKALEYVRSTPTKYTYETHITCDKRSDGKPQCNAVSYTKTGAQEELTKALENAIQHITFSGTEKSQLLDLCTNIGQSSYHHHRS